MSEIRDTSDLPPTFVASLVNNLRKRRDGSYTVSIVDRVGHHALIVRSPAIVTFLTMAMRGTERGEVLVDLWVLDGRYVTRVDRTPIPDLG